jgi:hypothetical protein
VTQKPAYTAPTPLFDNTYYVLLDDCRAHRIVAYIPTQLAGRDFIQKGKQGTQPISVTTDVSSLTGELFFAHHFLSADSENRE